MSYQPCEDESLGAYVKRLRTEEAAKVLGRPVPLERLVSMAAHLPAPQRLSVPWLSKLEAGEYTHPNGDKLRTLARVISQLLETTLPEEWFLAQAGHAVINPAEPLPSSLEDPVLLNLLRNPEVMQLALAAGHLAEMGQEEKVRLLLTLAKEYVEDYSPAERPSDAPNRK